MFELDGSRELSAAARAQWLADLAEALDQAQKLIWSVGHGTGDSPATMELYTRIEAARVEVRTLRLRGGGESAAKVDPKWSELLPWRNGVDRAGG